MKKYTIVLLTILIGCISNQQDSNQSNSSQPYINAIHPNSLSKNLVDLLWGNSNYYDTSNYLEASIFYINKSDYKKASIFFEKSYDLNLLNIGGFTGFKFDNRYFAQNYEHYCLFRLDEFTKNIGDNALLNQLLQAIFQRKDSLYKLSYAEFFCFNSDNLADNISYIKSLQKEYPKSLRLDYLLANQYLKGKNLDTALALFDNLIKSDYYALPSLRNVIQYLSDAHDTLINKYLFILDTKYPSACDLFKLNKSFKKTSFDSLPLICSSCINSVFQRDSVYAGVLLAQYYLSINNIGKADSMAENYIQNLDKKTFDSTVLFEGGNYMDLKMRILFKEKKYSALCDFIKFKLQDNPVINIDNASQLRMYIQNLYIGYISFDLTNFNSFFESNFHSCFKENSDSNNPKNL
jgi:hypothetical protein